MKTRFKAAGRRPILSHTDIYKQLMNVSPVMKKMESSMKKKRGRPLGSKNKPKVIEPFVPRKNVNQNNVFLRFLKPGSTIMKSALFLDWSLFIKAPVTNWMTFSEFDDYYKQWYMEGLPVDTYRCSTKECVRIMHDNKAGKNGEHLAFHEIQQQYGYLSAEMRSKKKKGTTIHAL